MVSHFLIVHHTSPRETNTWARTAQTVTFPIQCHPSIRRAMLSKRAHSVGRDSFPCHNPQTAMNMASARQNFHLTKRLRLVRVCSIKHCLRKCSRLRKGRLHSHSNVRHFKGISKVQPIILNSTSDSRTMERYLNWADLIFTRPGWEMFSLQAKIVHAL